MSAVSCQVSNRVIARADMSLLNTVEYKSKVSTVLNKDAKQNGKQFLFDGEVDTAWSSDEGTPQWILIQFNEPQRMDGFSFQFQGGFAGKECTVIVESADGATICEEPFYPDDINSVQSFKLKNPVEDTLARRVKFLFGGSTDFFGRIIVYDLKLQ